jgi:NitT/TauT family transport system substrate-binding protein
MGLIKNYTLPLLVCMLILISAVGCENEVTTIKIAEQYGIAYAPLQVMKENHLLEEALGDGYQVEWIKLSNTAAIREAMLGDGLDIGFMGIPPFLIGVDAGMDWKIMTGLSESPLGLVVNDPAITDLSLLLENGKIALPQPGSIQHILLAMAAQKQLGDAKAFDVQLISMKHPDGMMALNAGTEVVGHYTSPPYIFQELENEQNHMLIDGIDGTGAPFTFIAGVCRKELFDNKKVYNTFIEALDKSIDLLNTRDSKVIEQLSQAYELDSDVLLSYMDKEGMSYNLDIKGVELFIDFMYGEEYLEKEITKEDVIWQQNK